MGVKLARPKLALIIVGLALLFVLGYLLNVSGSDYFFYFVILCMILGGYWNYRLFRKR